MKFLKLNLSWLFYLDFTVFHILWKRLGTNRRNWRSVCSHNLFWSAWGGTADMAGVLQGLVMGSPGRTGWDGEGCTVLWRFLLWECHRDSWSYSFWVNEESVESCGSGLAAGQQGSCWKVPAGASQWMSGEQWVLFILISLGWWQCACNILINKVMEVQTGQTDSEIDWKLDELPGSKSCDQQHKVQLGTDH